MYILIVTGYRTVPDASARFVRDLVANEPRVLDNIADLIRELNAPVLGSIIVPRDSFNSAASHIIPIKEWTGLEDENTHTLSVMIQHCLNSPSSSGEEMDVTHRASELTVRIWAELDKLAPSLYLQSGLNLADTSGATKKGLRPDVCVWVKGALLLKAEIKRNAEEMDTAKTELVAKMRTWNPVALRGLPFLPCFVAAGNLLQFCAILPPSGNSNMKLCDVSDLFNMGDALGCLSIIRASLNMMRVFMCLRKKLPLVVPKLFYQQLRGKDGSSIEIRDDCVIKRCRPAPLAVYENLNDPSSLPCAITVVIGRSMKNGMCCLQIRPVCLEQLPSTVEELRVSIRCVLTALCAFHERGFVHRDVRWPNVLKDKERWLLADFELADFAGSPVPDRAIASAYLPPEVLADKRIGYSKAGDVYCVGKLLEEWEQKTGADLPPAACAFRLSLMNNDPDLRPTASQVLAESWVSA
jgi:hypothetical protein